MPILIRHLLLASSAAFGLTHGVSYAADTGPAKSDEPAEVIITAAPYAVSLQTLTTSVNVIGRNELDMATPAGLGDVLNGLSGVRSTFFGPGASRPVIRGLSGPRVMILQNGVGLVDASSVSPDHAVASDPGEATRIEVLRGPSTLAYGGSGIGGVVNIIDDRVPSTKPQSPIEGRLSGSYETGNEGGSVSGSIKTGMGPIVVVADMVTRRSSDYEVPSNPISDRLAKQDGLTAATDRKVLNSTVELDAYGAGASYIGERGYIGASVKRTDTTYGVPYRQITAPIDPADEGPVELHMKQTRLDIRGERELDIETFSKIQFSIGHADYQHAEIVINDGTVGTRFLSKGTEARFELVHREHEGHKGAIGLQALQRDFEAIGDEAFVPSVQVSELGLFTLQRLDRDLWGIDLGARIDQRKLTGELSGRTTSAAAASGGLNWSKTNPSQSFTNVSTSAGLFWKPNDQIFYALSLARNGRAPSEVELFADGPHGGTSTYEIGNPNFKSEVVTSIEATVRYTTDRARLEGHLYRAYYKGFIEENPTGQVQNDLPVFRFTQTGADFYGFELDASYDLWTEGERSLTLDLGSDLVRGDTDAGSPARIPPYSITGKIGWQTAAYSAELELRHVGAADRHLARRRSRV
ncbi:MAG: TonB-dependent receptor, partial [Caulobacteraceae bacterium]|nr:TonB-dependent receptor [Caulobacteraceae bacterium]